MSTIELLRFLLYGIVKLFVISVDPTPNQMQVPANHNNNNNTNDAANGTITNR